MNEAQQTGIGQVRNYPLWARGPASVVGDEIVLDEGRAQKHDLYELPELMFDLADLAADWNNRDPRGVVTFVRRHGLLWHGAGNLGTGKCRESLEEWWKASRGIAVLIELYGDLQSSLETGSAEPLRNGRLNFPAYFEETEPDDQALIEFASQFIAELVSENLKGCRLGIVSTVQLDVKPQRPDVFFLQHAPPDLLTAAYVEFSQTLTNRVPMAECPGCGRLFPAKSRKQKYCTPSCASTSRWRRWKERQAE